MKIDRSLESVSGDVNQKAVGPDGEYDRVHNAPVVVHRLVLEVQRLEEELRFSLCKLGRSVAFVDVVSQVLEGGWRISTFNY